MFAAAAAALVALLGYERRRHEPVIDPRFFGSAPVSSAIAITVAAYAAFGAFLFLTTLYLQRVRGLTPVQAGAVLAPIGTTTRAAESARRTAATFGLERSIP